MKDQLQNERGFVVPFVAILIPIFLAIMGLMVDVGVASSHYFRLANAVDAAAYAALAAYEEEAWEENDEIIIDYDEARAVATTYLQANLSHATLKEFHITSGGRGVRVEAEVHSPVFFMKMFGFQDRVIGSFAEAELMEPDESS